MFKYGNSCNACFKSWFSGMNTLIFVQINEETVMLVVPFRRVRQPNKSDTRIKIRMTIWLFINVTYCNVTFHPNLFAIFVKLSV